MSKTRSLKWNITENSVRKGQNVGEELKDMTLKYFSSTQLIFWPAMGSLLVIGAHTQRFPWL